MAEARTATTELQENLEWAHTHADFILQEGILISEAERNAVLDKAQEIISCISECNYKDANGNNHLGLDLSTEKITRKYMKLSEIVDQFPGKLTKKQKEEIIDLLMKNV